MGWNLPPGCTDAHIDSAIRDDGQREEQDAWEYWHQRATEIDAENHQLRAEIVRLRALLPYGDGWDSGGAREAGAAGMKHPYR